MKWLYANPIVLNLVILIIALLIVFCVPLAVVLIIKALFVADDEILGFIGFLSFFVSSITVFMWVAGSWRC